MSKAIEDIEDFKGLAPARRAGVSGLIELGRAFAHSPRTERSVQFMAVTAEIKTGQRRIIEFLLSPLARRVEEAGRER